MTRSIRWTAIGLMALATLAGCSARQPVYDGKVASHSLNDFKESPKAVFANQVPVYPGAKVVDAMGSESSGDEADSYSEGMCWWLKTTDSTVKVVAFYDAALPNAERRQNEEDGSFEWSLVPAGGRGADRVSVHVKDGEIMILEDVQGGRRRNR